MTLFFQRIHQYKMNKK